jgi:EmrB/QacA subfamily drug resistance transporter
MVDTLAPSDQDIDPAMGDLTRRRRVWTLFVACLGVLLVVASLVALNTALGDIATSTNATQTQLTWIVDSYTLAMACLLLPAGAIGDRYGRRGALRVGLVVFAVASAAPVIWSDPGYVIIARGLAGAGAAFIMPATLSLITSAYRRQERTKAVAIWAGVAGCGGVAGMLGSGVLLRFWPWQSIFWGFAATALALFIATFSVGTSKDPDSTPLDWIGAVLIGGAVAVLVLGILEAPMRGWIHPEVLGCLAAGVVLAVLFAVVELRRRHPLLDVRLFRVPEFATGAAAITVMFMAMFGFFFLVMQFIQLVLGYSALGTALAIAPLALPLMVLSPLSSWYLPKFGLRAVVLVGMLLLAGGLMSMRMLHLDSSYWELAWPLLTVSTGIGLFTAPTTSAIMTAVPDDKQGVASAVNDTTREVGAALGIALAGSMLAAQYSSRIAPSLTALPGPVRDASSGSLAEALQVARRLGPQGAQLTDAARLAFLGAFQSSMLALAVVVVIAAVFITVLAPGRDGRRFGFVRRLGKRRALN